MNGFAEEEITARKDEILLHMRNFTDVTDANFSNYIFQCSQDPDKPLDDVSSSI